ncbi:hypothetical protein L6164_030108 [Bauhinia variegata]|uniref:Uncharacterized protein n=1 Tax=Bauhinia variegata TaxID=167791 RepID=A0ACB9LAQ6_BAUVA|nr:hypothetical protein L6164_030108 [Bauhinia variegata]
MEKLVEVCEPEVRIEFALNCKCRTTVRLRCLIATPVAFKIQTSSPHKFLVKPPTGVIPPLSHATFQVILKPQTQLPSSYPRSPSDRFLIKTAEFVPNSSASTLPDSINSWFASRPSKQDLKLKVAFVGPVLLRHAVAGGDLDAVRNLIKRQKSILSDLPPSEAESLLRAATELVNPEHMVHLLLEAGLRIETSADPTLADDPGRSPPHNARDDGHDEEGEILDQGEAMLTAARHGDVKQLESLIRRGASVNYHDQYGLTALHAAAIKGQKDAVLMLSNAGLDLECEDEEGHVPLHMAVEGGALEVVEVLVNKGVNINAKNKRGATPLYMAQILGYGDIFEFLNSRGASSSLPQILQ